MNRSFIVSSGSATIHQEPVTEESVLSMLGGGQFGAEKAQCGLRSSSCQCYCLPSMRRRTRALEKSHGSCWGRWGGSLPELKSVVLTACPCFPSPPSHLPDLRTLHGLMVVSLRHDGKANGQGRPEENAGPLSLPGLPWRRRALVPVAEQRSGRARVSGPLSRAFPEQRGSPAMCSTK